jgi:hypothetical protein
MRVSRCVPAAVLLAAIASGAASAAEISYRGEWRCEALPSANLGPSRAEAFAIRDGARLTVSRPVRTRDGAREVGRETGTTTIRDGRFSLETSTTMARTMINGSFTGTATDQEIAFSGTQKMQLASGGFGERRCTVRLTRQ